MSSLPISPAAISTLPEVNIHPHGHAHKKGSLLDPFTNSSSSTAAQIPVGSSQNLFATLFNSLHQIIAAQPATAAANPAASVAKSAASNATAVGAKINVMT
jgi:hypothetical protein